MCLYARCVRFEVVVGLWVWTPAYNSVGKASGVVVVDSFQRQVQILNRRLLISCHLTDCGVLHQCEGVGRAGGGRFL